jgi:MFS family permease
VSVPFGVFGTVWAYTKLIDNGVRIPSKIDWVGNATFAIGLTSLLTGVVYGIQPYGGHPMGWTNPGVLAALFGGALTLVVFAKVETIVPNPMFRLRLFRIRAFTAGSLASLLGALSRGGLQFMLIIWLQGIWLPQHGYSFTRTPLWAGIYMIPLTLGFLIAGPISGVLSDRYGARAFATLGMIATAIAFVLLQILPINFGYVWFSLLLLLMGLAMGLFASPNRAAIMNSLPAAERGVGSGMATTFQNSATVLSMGIFFTVITLGLAQSLPSALFDGLRAQGVPSASAHQIASLPPIGVLFASFLGYNPIQHLLGPSGVLSHLRPSQLAYLTGRSYFPHLITPSFGQGLDYACDFAIACSLVAAAASWMRGPQASDPSAPNATAAVEVEEGLIGTADAAPLVSNDLGADARPEPARPLRRGRTLRPARRT